MLPSRNFQKSSLALVFFPLYKSITPKPSEDLRIRVTGPVFGKRKIKLCSPEPHTLSGLAPTPASTTLGNPDIQIASFLPILEPYAFPWGREHLGKGNRRDSSIFNGLFNLFKFRRTTV